MLHEMGNFTVLMFFFFLFVVCLEADEFEHEDEVEKRLEGKKAYGLCAGGGRGGRQKECLVKPHV